MCRRLSLVTALILSSFSLPSVCMAQATTASATSKPSKKVYVAFFMAKWKAQHIHDEAAAKKHINTLETLGCEVKTAKHNGHIDVSARTVSWKTLELDSSEQAQQWANWLQKVGFETLHGRKPGEQKRDSGAKHELVLYRLNSWRSFHIHDQKKEIDLICRLRGLGCEVQTVRHGNHNDVKARCPDWMEIEFGSHEVAHAWQEVLGELGFETKHSH